MDKLRQRTNQYKFYYIQGVNTRTEIIVIKGLKIISIPIKTSIPQNKLTTKRFQLSLT